MCDLGEISRRIIDSKLMTDEAAQSQLARWRSETGAEEKTGDGWLNWLVDQRQLTALEADAVEAGCFGPPMLGPFRICDRLSVGRQGTIYRAVHLDSQQPVSIKILPSGLGADRERLVRLRRELRANALLDHPNVVRMYQVGDVGGVVYLVFEGLLGGTLRDRLGQEGKIPYPAACRLMRDAAAGLAHFHDKFIVHRDVRPEVMWISDDGALKVMASGTIRRALTDVYGTDDTTVTTTGTVLGTYDYMAPEQWRDAHAADHRSDIYSLGCTLYHCLAGHPPFVDRNPMQQIKRHTDEVPAAVSTLVAGVPEELDEIVASMLAKSPEDRFQSMTDVQRELEMLAECWPSSGLAAPVPEEFLPWLGDAEDSEAVVSQSPPSPQAAAFLQWLVEDSHGQRD